MSAVHLAILMLFSFLTVIAAESNTDEENEIIDHKEIDKATKAKIEKYLQLLEKKKNAIDKFLEENYTGWDRTMDAEEYVSHPINAYMLMKRTSVVWQAAKKDILDTSADQLWKEIQKDLEKLPKKSTK